MGSELVKILGIVLLIMSLVLCLWGCGEGAVPPPETTAESTGLTETVTVQGTVLAVTDTSLHVQTEEGEQSFTLTEETIYTRDFGGRGPRPDGMMTGEDGQQPPQPPIEGQQPPAEGQQPPIEGQQPPIEGQQPPQPPTDGETSAEGSGGFTPGNGTQGGAPAPGSSEGKDFGDPNKGPNPMEPQTITREEIAVGQRVRLTVDPQGLVLTLTVEPGQPNDMGQPPVPPVTEAVGG